MKLVVFGATGATGRELVGLALEQGHAVTAFARDPAKLGLSHPNLSVIRGDVLDPASVQRAVHGQEAVLCTIGAGAKRGTLRADGTRNIAGAMEKAGVRRLVCQSSYGVGDTRDKLSFLLKYVLVPLVLRHAFADHEAQERVIRQSRLDWTIVRPVGLVKGPKTGIYRHGNLGAAAPARATISHADVAEFMLKQLTEGTYLRQTPGLAY